MAIVAMGNLWDDLTAPVKSVLDTLEDAFSSIPGAKTILAAVSGPVRDFANTAAGRVVFSAIATSLTGGLAPFLGPQLATVAWALPGLARGQDFVTAWTQEVAARASETAAILGTPAIGDVISAQIAQCTAYLTQNGIDVAVYGLEDVTGAAMKQLAADANVSDLAAATVLDYARGRIVDLGRQFDPVSGKAIDGARRFMTSAILGKQGGIAQSRDVVHAATLTNAILGKQTSLSRFLAPAAAPASAVVRATGAAPPKSGIGKDVAIAGVVVAAVGALVWWQTKR